MTLMTVTRWVAANVDHWVVTALDGLVKLAAWVLRGFTPVRGGGLIHWDRGYWQGRPWFDAWREPRAYTVRVRGYELIIDLAEPRRDA